MNMGQNLPLQYYPAEILRQQSTDISLEEIAKPEFAQLISDMEETMEANDGIGLAAPQIGQSINLAIIKTEDGMLPLINPKITRRSLTTESMEEGCLSIPKVYGDVRRPKVIRVSSLDLQGNKTKFTAKGMLARVIQHEVDHLNGVLFIDKAKSINQGQDILEKLALKG